MDTKQTKGTIFEGEFKPGMAYEYEGKFAGVIVNESDKPSEVELCKVSKVYWLHSNEVIWEQVSYDLNQLDVFAGADDKTWWELGAFYIPSCQRAGDVNIPLNTGDFGRIADTFEGEAYIHFVAEEMRLREVAMAFSLEHQMTQIQDGSTTVEGDYYYTYYFNSIENKILITSLKDIYGSVIKFKTYAICKEFVDKHLEEIERVIRGYRYYLINVYQRNQTFSRSFNV